MRIYTVDWTNFDGFRREHIGNKDDALKRFREIRDDLDAPVEVQFIDLPGDKTTIIAALDATALLNMKVFADDGVEMLSALPGDPETIASHEGKVPEDPDLLESQRVLKDTLDANDPPGDDYDPDEDDDDSEDGPEDDEDDLTEDDPGGIDASADQPDYEGTSFNEDGTPKVAEHDAHPDARKRELRADRWLEAS